MKQRGDSICGETDHLTNFAILLNGDGNVDCNDDGDFIFNTLEQDAILIGCVAAALWFCLVLLALFAIYTTWKVYNVRRRGN